MKILTLNARNWNRDKDPNSPYYWKTRMAAMRRMLTTIAPDIICFQEMVFPATLYIPDDYRRVGFSISHHIYVKKGLKTRQHRFRIHEEKVEVFYNKEWWLIINVHSSWKAETHTKVLKRIQKWVNESHAWYANCLACGDFNNPFREMKEMSLIESLPKDTPTFRRFDRDSTGTIDYFLSACPVGDEKAFVVQSGYGAERISDHYPVLLQIDLPALSD